MNQYQCKKVLEQKLIPQLNVWFPNGDFIFMHDGTPCYKAVFVTKLLNEKKKKKSKNTFMTLK